jgi:superfamily II DNA or RNA helicase
LAHAVGGLVKFIEQGGKALLVCSIDISPEDTEAVRKGYQDRAKLIEQKLLFEIKNADALYAKESVDILAWMVKHNIIDIKVAVRKDFERGIFHPKFGLCYDDEGHVVAFEGSSNETKGGLLENREAVSVDVSWDDSPRIKEKIRMMEQEFDELWKNSDDEFDVIALPDAVRSELKNRSPATRPVDEPFEKYHRNFNPNRLKPWFCQSRAIDAVTANNFRGVLKMATGTGKTSCTLFVIDRFFQQIKKSCNRILILVPSGKDGIGGQWESFLTKNLSSKDFVFRYDSEASESDRRSARNLWKSNLDDMNLFLIITIQSLQNFEFGDQPPDLIIADEVHEYGTENRMTQLLAPPVGLSKYRVGLSATPERFYDPDGTKRILEFFGPIVFRYSLREAQTEPKVPGSESVLANYYYHLSFVPLTQDEEDEVERLTNAIGKNVAMENDPEITEGNLPVNDRIKKLLQDRARKLKLAENKIVEVEDLLKRQISTLGQCIVYCEQIQQLDRVQEVLDKNSMKSYVKFHFEVKNKSDALDLFRANNCKMILSINCLDQGIDIPTCESLIMLTGSTNPRQYIQRRGRVLRNYKTKPPVHIYDIVALPQRYNEAYRGLIKARLLQVWAFIRDSQSPEEGAKIINIRKQYNITEEELEQEVSRWE